jgi:hypothetical protein
LLSDGGHWHYCFDCKRKGDLVELAAGIWQLPIRDTLARLRDMALFTDTRALDAIMQNEKEMDPWKYRQAIMAFWETASERARTGSGGSTLGDLRNKLGIRRLGQRPDVWAAGLGQLFGETTAKEARALAHPIEDFAGQKRMRRREWKNVLVLPYCQVPEHISAFLFVGREGKQSRGDHNYQPLTARTYDEAPDAGLWGMSTAWTAGDGWHDCVLALEDPVLALRLQQQHLLANRLPVPIVCWYDNGAIKSTQCWRTLRGKRVIFVADTLTPRLMQQVKIARGELVIYDTTYDATRFWKDTSAKDMVHQFSATAKPLGEAIADWLRTAKAVEIEELCLACERANFDLEAELKAINRPLLERARQSAGKTANRLPTIQLSRDTKVKLAITECENEWLISSQRTKTQDVGCNCVLRIDRTIFCPGLDSPIYAGRVLYKKDVIDFQVLSSRLVKVKSCRLWLAKLLLKRLGIPLQVDRRIAGELLKIALMFRQPERVDSSPRVGWINDGQQFQLPNLTIGSSIQTRLVRTRLVPGLKFKKVEQPDFSGMRNNESSHAFWALLSLGLANIIAPLHGKETAGIGLLGKGASEMGRLVAEHALGIAPFRGVSSLGETTGKIRKLESRHAWPVYTDKASEQPFYKPWLQLYGVSKNAIVPLSPRLSKGLPLLAAWRLVTIEEPLREMAWMRTEGEKIVPSYLEHICQNQVQFNLRKHWAKVILEDLAEWVGEREGDPGCVLAATKYWRLDLPASQGKAVLDVLLAGYMSDRISNVRIEFERTVRLGVFTVENESERYLIVPPSAFIKSADRLGLGVLSPAIAEKALADAGYLLGHQTTGPRTGWRVNLDVWNDCLKGL